MKKLYKLISPPPLLTAPSFYFRGNHFYRVDAHAQADKEFYYYALLNDIEGELMSAVATKETGVKMAERYAKSINKKAYKVEGEQSNGFFVY